MYGGELRAHPSVARRTLAEVLEREVDAPPVLFLDTVHHFAETYAYRDSLAERWHLNVVTLRASEPRPGLWQTDTDACCARHKVGPLFAALERYDLATAQDRDRDVVDSVPDPRESPAQDPDA